MSRTPAEGCIFVVVEIPRGSRNKYEIDHDTGQVFLDRRLFTATTATRSTRSCCWRTPCTPA